MFIDKVILDLGLFAELKNTNIDKIRIDFLDHEQIKQTRIFRIDPLKILMTGEIGELEAGIPYNFVSSYMTRFGNGPPSDPTSIQTLPASSPSVAFDPKISNEAKTYITMLPRRSYRLGPHRSWQPT